MKPLKDIGREVYIVANQPDLVDRIIYEPMCDGHQVEFLYSLEERRELVREAIMKWERTKWERLVSMDNRHEIPNMEEFFKENGL